MAIRVLDEGTAARIAAGEVIERPSSVVKELIENSLDAGATRIDVAVEGGGVGLVRVVDDGIGIAADEVELAFQRFATSKVDASSDLLGISTLGFRGEALPSIASVARVEIASRDSSNDADGGAGARMTLAFGEVVESARAGLPAGTSIAVSDLFGNVPARKKFLRSPGAELSRIQQLVTAYAVVRADVAFRLTADGRPRASTPGGGDRRGAVAGTYGPRVAAEMLELSEPVLSPGVETLPAFAVGGLVGGPSLSRGNRNYITIGVNGRWIQSRRISYAVEQAYHGFLGERRFPVGVVLVRAPLHDVDVNVHPAKTEVRFLREDLVFAEVQRTVRAALVAAAPVPSFSASRVRPLATPVSPESVTSAAGSPSRGPAATIGQPTTLARNPLWPEPSIGVVPNVLDDEQPVEARAAPDAAAQPVHRDTLPVLRVIGQAHETYILAEGPDGVYLIDQHAAHERVRYEEIVAALTSGHPDAQQLLEPEPVSLGPQQEEFLSAQAKLVAGLGFVIEPFGPGTMLIRAVPKMLAERTSAAGDALLGLLDEVVTGGRPDAWRDRFVATLACHSSVRAGMRLTDEEGRALVRRLEGTEQPHTCPHGRPTMIHVSEPDLERGFGRR